MLYRPELAQDANRGTSAAMYAILMAAMMDKVGSTAM
jgi:hypothetical protein